MTSAATTRLAAEPRAGAGDPPAGSASAVGPGSSAGDAEGDAKAEGDGTGPTEPVAAAVGPTDGPPAVDGCTTAAEGLAGRDDGAPAGLLAWEPAAGEAACACGGDDDGGLPAPKAQPSTVPGAGS